MQKFESIIRAWLFDSERIRVSRSRKVPSEQDIQDVLALLNWPEHEHYLENEHTARIGASVMLGYLELGREGRE